MLRLRCGEQRNDEHVELCFGELALAVLLQQARKGVQVSRTPGIMKLDAVINDQRYGVVAIV